jgi:hypothetical protein
MEDAFVLSKFCVAKELETTQNLCDLVNLNTKVAQHKSDFELLEMTKKIIAFLISVLKPFLRRN